MFSHPQQSSECSYTWDFFFDMLQTNTPEICSFVIKFGLQYIYHIHSSMRNLALTPRPCTRPAITPTFYPLSTLSSADWQSRDSWRQIPVSCTSPGKLHKVCHPSPAWVSQYSGVGEGCFCRVLSSVCGSSSLCSWSLCLNNSGQCLFLVFLSTTGS